MSCNFRFTKTVSSLILQMTDLTGNNYSLHMFFEHCFLLGSTRYFYPPLSIKAIPTHLPLTHRKRDFDNRSKRKTENFQKLSWITASSALLQSPSVEKRCSATGCGLWNHRTCCTGIHRQTYRAAVRGEVELEWRCRPCRVYVFGTTMEWSGKFFFFP